MGRYLTEHKGLILMLNRTGSEVSMVNSSNYFLSPGGLVCPLDLQPLGKAGLQFILKALLQAIWVDFKGKGFCELKAMFNYFFIKDLRTERMLSEGP